MNKYLEDQPRGLDTNIGENGSQISEEKMRLALARTLFKQSDILVFDEATSFRSRKRNSNFEELSH